MTEPLKVYYDGGCPVCKREIAFYKAQPDNGAFEWVDASGGDPSALGPGLSREMALKAMHVRLPDGRLLSGAAAFAEMWRRMPRFRWLGTLLGVPPVNVIAEFGYRGFLIIRKLWR
jgi:predicted DCC family thiol-disulfide oxidoreductase YuxK